MRLSKQISDKGYVGFGRVEFMERLTPHYSTNGMEQIEAAYFISKNAHSTQMRDDGTRYFEHPKTVAWLLFDRYKFYSWRVIVIALLHDIVEDSYIMNEGRIKLNWGRRVARGVVILSKNTFPASLLKDSHAPYYQRILQQGSWECQAVKVADRIHNLSTSESLDPKRQAKKIAETISYFPAIVQALADQAPARFLPGINKMREDLDQLCAEWSVAAKATRPDAFGFTLHHPHPVSRIQKNASLRASELLNRK